MFSFISVAFFDVKLQRHQEGPMMHNTLPSMVVIGRLHTKPFRVTRISSGFL